MPDEYKRCSRCRTVLPRSAFPSDRSKLDGLHYWCRGCKSVTSKARSKTPEFRAKNRAKNAKRYQRAREIFYALKARPCMDCGGSFPHYVMEFDHPNRAIKTGNISQMAMAGITQKLLDELAVTDLVCSNCHKVRTRRQFERGEWKPGRPRFDGTHHTDDAIPYPTVMGALDRPEPAKVADFEASA